LQIPTTFKYAEELLSQLFNVHSVSDVRHTEIYAAEPSVPDPSPVEDKIAITKLKK
jgi:hypothetical protein